MTDDDPGSGKSEHLPAATWTGDASDLWQQADKFRPYLESVAGRLLAGRLAEKADPADVVQQALLAAVEHLDQFQGKSVAEWHAWLLTIVRHKVFKLLRYWQRDSRDVHREQHLASDSSGGPQRVADESSPSGTASKREQAGQLMAALARLPTDYERVIRLRHMDDLSFAEIAGQMGLTEGAVRQLWVRAVRRLRDELGDKP